MLSRFVNILELSLLLAAPFWAQQASVRQTDGSWTLATDKVRRLIVLERGKLYTKRWTDLVSGRELVSQIQPDEFAATINGVAISGSSGNWRPLSTRQQKRKDGSLQFDLAVENGIVAVTKSYVLYPGSSLVREWVTFRNAGSGPLTIENPFFLRGGFSAGRLPAPALQWMTGGENRAGSWLLKSEKLVAGKRREFDSYDPFPGAADSKFGFKMGSATYAPWYSLYDAHDKQGVFLGFDYFGRWASSFTLSSPASVSIGLKVSGYRKVLNPGETVTTPKAFTGLYRDDLDNAGNECLDWQYRYLWDYTRKGWFPAIRMLGWWWNGTPWKDPGHTWVGGNGDSASAFRKVFRVADLMSEVGADVYHRDWGWWNHAGDWSGPDFKAMGAYLAKRGMGKLIYAFIYTVDRHSKIAQEHPDWVINDTLDMSNPAVVHYLDTLLDGFAARFGPFEWRNDSVPSVPHGSDDTPLLAQDQNFRAILGNFLNRHPDDAFQGVNGGGNDAGYDYARYASTLSFSDGAVGILRNYWASLILAPDKSSDIPDAWQPDKYDKSTWRGLLTINFDMTGDTWNPARLEGVRQLIDIYHYLESQGVVGRWVHVYRPGVKGDDPSMYFERLSRDGAKGILIPKHVPPHAVTIWPKGLTPSASYAVSFQESAVQQQRTGADLMKTGIHFEKMPSGELVYLNLPLHPGSRLYRTPPSPATEVRKQSASNLGYPGIELRWNPAHDHWISYYEISRGGAIVDRVAKGLYYFDHSAGADLAAAYAVQAVNGGGLRSEQAKASGPNAQPATVLDDTPGARMTYSGKWNRESDVQPAYLGTLSSAEKAGASFTFPVDGARFTWFTRMCAECGLAEVAIDGRKEAVVNTYSADDIFGVGVYGKSFAPPGRHTVTITVIGRRQAPRGQGTRVYNDGIRVSSREPRQGE